MASLPKPPINNENAPPTPPHAPVQEVEEVDAAPAQSHEHTSGTRELDDTPLASTSRAPTTYKPPFHAGRRPGSGS